MKGERVKGKGRKRRQHVSAREVEYPIPFGTAVLWSLRHVFITVLAAEGAAFLVGLVVILGVVEEHSFGHLTGGIPLDPWGRAWVALAALGGVFGLAPVVVAVSTWARASLARALDGPAAQEGAWDAVPVGWQLRTLVGRTYEAAQVTAWAIGGTTALFAVVAGPMALAEEGDDRAAVATIFGVCAATAAVCVVAARRLGRLEQPGALAREVWGHRVEADPRAQPADDGWQPPSDATRGDRAHVVRHWLTSVGTKRLLVAALVTGAMTIVMVFIRKPGKHADTRHYGEGAESFIDLVWQGIVVVLVTLVVALTLGWLTVVVVDAWRTTMLRREAGAVQAAREQGTTAPDRPVDSMLADVLDGAPVPVRVGQAAVALGAVLVPVAWGGLIAAPEPGDARYGSQTADAVDALSVLLPASVALLVVGFGLVLGGWATAARSRAAIRSAWPREPRPIVLEKLQGS